MFSYFRKRIEKTFIEMGSKHSRIKTSSKNNESINKTDLEFLLDNTHFNVKEIKEWYQSFIVRSFIKRRLHN